MDCKAEKRPRRRGEIKEKKKKRTKKAKDVKKREDDEKARKVAHITPITVAAGYTKWGKFATQYSIKKYLQREMGVSEDVKITNKNMVQMWDKYYKPPLDVTLGSDLDDLLEAQADLDVSLGTDLDVSLGLDAISEEKPLGSEEEDLLALLDQF